MNKTIISFIIITLVVLTACGETIVEEPIVAEENISEPEAVVEQEEIIEVEESVIEKDSTDKTERLLSDNLKAFNWYKVNAELEDISEEDRIKKTLINQGDILFKIHSRGCEISIGAIAGTNRNRLGLYYIETAVPQEIILGEQIKRFLPKQKDTIQSLSELLINGDDLQSEEFSLLFKAELNYLINLCKEDNKKVIILTYGWDGKGFPIEKTFEGYTHPNIICGNFVYFQYSTRYSSKGYNIMSTTYNHHCMMALTKKPITSTHDLSFLKGALIFEAQNSNPYGFFEKDNGFSFPNKNVIEDYLNQSLTKQSIESVNILLDSVLERSLIDDDTPGYVLTIITNNDVFFYDTEDYEWYSVSELKSS